MTSYGVGDIVEPCRLCGAGTQFIFRKTVLGYHDVSYLECDNCHSLQTEKPYWLAEAYAGRNGEDGAHDNLNSLDVGAAQRNLTNMAATLVVADMLKLTNVLDQGGGDGLLCRLLRDYGLNAYVQDRYAVSTYAQGFENHDFTTPDLITAFEVFEHFEDPATDIAAVFEGRPRTVLITTETYDRQGVDWWYLIPETGHHVFFYSAKAFAIIAERFGYSYIKAGAYSVFIRDDAAKAFLRRRLLLRLHPRMLKLALARTVLRTPPGVSADFARVLARKQAGQLERS